MDWIYYLLLAALLISGLLINIFGLPGLWLMLAAAGAYAWATHARYIGWWGLFWLLILCIAAEIVEFVAGGAGAKKEGGTIRGMIGAIIGGVLGGIFLTFVPIPVVSTIVGVCLGTFLGALVVELGVGQETHRSIRIGIGAAKGRLWGTLAKMMIGFLILIVALCLAVPLRGTSPSITTPATAPTLGAPAISK